MGDEEVQKNRLDTTPDDLVLYICGGFDLSFYHIRTLSMTCKRFAAFFIKGDKADVLLRKFIQEHWIFFQGEVIKQRNLHERKEDMYRKDPPTFDGVVDYLFEITKINDSLYKKCQLLYSAIAHRDGTIYGSYVGAPDLHGWGIMCMYGEVTVGKFEHDDLKYGKIIGVEGDIRIGHFDDYVADMTTCDIVPHNPMIVRDLKRIFDKKKFVNNTGIFIKYAGPFTFIYTGIFCGGDFQSGVVSGRNWIINGNFVAERDTGLLDYHMINRLYLSNNCVLQVPEEDFSVSLPFVDAMSTRIRESEISSYLPPSAIKSYNLGLCRKFHSASNKGIPTIMFMGDKRPYCLHCIKNCVEPYPVDDGTLVVEMRLFTLCVCLECENKSDRACKQCVRYKGKCAQCIEKLIQPTQKRLRLM